MAQKLAAREEELRVANQHLDALANRDGLTGLANRRGFDQALERAWQKAGEHRAPLALMMMDIDHFKLFNDRYGHAALLCSIRPRMPRGKNNTMSTIRMPMKDIQLTVTLEM